MYAENVSAQKAAQKERARLQKENVRQKRPQGPGSPQSKGQSPSDLLIDACSNQTAQRRYAVVRATDRRGLAARCFVFCRTSPVMSSERGGQKDSFQRGLFFIKDSFLMV